MVISRSFIDLCQLSDRDEHNIVVTYIARPYRPLAEFTLKNKRCYFIKGILCFLKCLFCIVTGKLNKQQRTPLEILCVAVWNTVSFVLLDNVDKTPVPNAEDFLARRLIVNCSSNTECRVGLLKNCSHIVYILIYLF